MPTNNTAKLARNDTLTLRHDYPHYGLHAGDIGVVVEVFDTAGLCLAYQVEFLHSDGEEQLVFLLPDQVEKCEK